MQRGKIPKRNIILFGICMIIALSMIILLMFYLRRNDSKLAVQLLDEGWTAEERGNVHENITLSETRYESFDKGDVLTIYRTFPETDIPDPTIEVYSVHSMIDVYLDGEHIFNYGREYYDTNRMMGYGWSLVRLPDDAAGKEIKIVFHIVEDNAFEGMPTVTILDGYNALKNILISERTYFSIGMFLVVLGALGMFFTLFMLFRSFSALKMFCIMLFAFLIGVYTLANTDLFTLYNLNMAQKGFLEYLSLYTFIIPISLYFADWITEEGFNRKLVIAYNIWILVEMLFVATVLVLHLTNTVHMPFFVTPCHIVMIGAIIMIILLAVERVKIHHKMDKGIAIGFALAIIVGGFELLRYNIAKYGVGFKNNRYSSTIGLAALIIVITLFYDFMSKVTETLYQNAQAKILEKMAYMDELTGILNRRGIEKPLNELKKSNSLYAIISLDMNLLKMMNDTFGHATGDRALSLLAKKLVESFPEPCACARVGGDEFVVSIPSTTKDWVEKHISEFLDKLYEHNVKGEKVTLSAAYGIAYSDEADSPEKVFGLADDRMYKRKKEMKLGRN